MSQTVSIHASSEAFATISPVKEKVVNAEQKPALSWFVMRYHKLTAFAQDELLKSGLDVFFPQTRIKRINARTGRTEYVIKPIITGYIFVKSTFEQAMAMSSFLGINLLKRYYKYTYDLLLKDDCVDSSEERLYYHIPDVEMKYFKRAVEIYKQNVMLTDASEIDLQQDDFVRIISGDFEGVRGYLKTTQGKNGGMVIVPVTSEKAPNRSGLCYSIMVTVDQIGVVNFASGNRHASDCIRSAQQMVEKALLLFAEGEPLSDDTRKQMHRYLARFKDAQFKTDKLKANHLLLLYSIYTMLGNQMLRDVVQEQIMDDVLPAFDARIADARRRGRPDGSSLKEKYLKQKEKVDRALRARMLKR